MQVINNFLSFIIVTMHKEKDMTLENVKAISSLPEIVSIFRII